MKKIISILCLFSMIISFSAYAETERVYNDEVTNKLTALGIIGTNDINLDKTEVTNRADYACMIACFIGYEATNQKPAKSSYADVTTDYWASEFIEAVTSVGVFKGHADGKFYPEDAAEILLQADLLNLSMVKPIIYWVTSSSQAQTVLIKTFTLIT